MKKSMDWLLLMAAITMLTFPDRHHSEKNTFLPHTPGNIFKVKIATNTVSEAGNALKAKLFPVHNLPPFAHQLIQKENLTLCPSSKPSSYTVITEMYALVMCFLFVLVLVGRLLAVDSSQGQNRQHKKED